MVARQLESRPPAITFTVRQGRGGGAVGAVRDWLCEHFWLRRVGQTALAEPPPR